MLIRRISLVVAGAVTLGTGIIIAFFQAVGEIEFLNSGQLAENLRKIEQKIANKRFLLGASTYSINTSWTKYVVGISPAAGYIPFVKIITSNCCVI